MIPETFSCVILDDDEFSRETLNDFFRSHNKINIIKSLGDSKMAIRDLATLKPDILILDINMPGKSGLDIQNEIKQLNLPTEIIFTTAYEEYVLEAFKNNAFDYLIKPIKKEDFDDSLTRLIDKLSARCKDLSTNTPQEKEVLYNDDRNKNINVSDEVIIRNAHTTLILKKERILYVAADNGYTIIQLNSGKNEVLSKNIGKYERYFSDTPFFRIGRGLIINTQYITKIDRTRCEVTISNSEKHSVLKASKTRLLDLEVFVSKLKLSTMR